mmetsp:Transcript_51817/g.144668  ORF Transcript_51817/g.144668 Transcript_51817/m.144668 type:complete len:146 (-) Transcript_51817:40-477(-)
MFFRFGPQAVARDGDVGILTDADGGGIGVGSTTMFEVLEVFGKPKIKNCMYGTYQWSSPFRLVQSYTSADISGQPDLDVQSRSSMENVYMSADGKLRVGKSFTETTIVAEECFYVFRKLDELETWFGEVGLPAGDQGMGGAGPGA